MYRDGHEDFWIWKFRKEWESLCLDYLGQKKYNETRGLEQSHKGTKEKPYIPHGGAYGNT